MGPVELVYVVGVVSPVGIVTVTKYEVPEGAAGAVAVIVEDPVTVTFVALKLPLVATPATSCTKVTVAPTSNPVPEIVTAVGPDVDPTAGVIADTVGTSGENEKTGVPDPTVLV